MVPFKNANVAEVFGKYPPKIRKKMMVLRELIFEVAAATEGVGEIEETLKWGEPSYITAKSKIGSTVRMDWKPSSPLQYYMYFHCKTSLVETFRTLFPSDFTYRGNREIVFHEDEDVSFDSLAFCVGMSLTYHRNKRQSRENFLTPKWVEVEKTRIKKL